MPAPPLTTPRPLTPPPQILDDLVDGWAADIHKEERVQFIHMLQRFSTDKHLRVTILSGEGGHPLPPTFVLLAAMHQAGNAE